MRNELMQIIASIREQENTTLHCLCTTVGDCGGVECEACPLCRKIIHKSENDIGVQYIRIAERIYEQ